MDSPLKRNALYQKQNPMEPASHVKVALSFKDEKMDNLMVESVIYV